MNTYDNDKRNGRINVQEFIGSRYLGQEDLDGETVVTLTHVVPEQVLEGDDDKLVAYFAELKKPLILNKTNLRRLANIFGTKWADAWLGPITVYVDPDVEMQGKVVGGIRVKRATNGASRRAETARRAAPRVDDVDFL
jgi:hypothetical protein